MDLLKLKATLGLDTSEYDQGIDSAKSKASGIGGALAAAATTGAAALGAAATAVGSLAKQSADAYGQYEQLVGGVNTLFGDSAEKVLEDASNAFTSAGMSMNEYMETSISSAASLINSLGGDQAQAAELMNVSITDMADNVNKMGTTMEAVQNAYRGFARGNFTMLDNLALGFAGTKEGMQELLDKAQEISGVTYDIDSYADIVQAIHVVQMEMGITGATADEAADTIQGSLGAVKAAWNNLVVGFADPNADFGKLIDNVVQTGKAALTNIIPAFKQALVGIGQFVKEIAPVIMAELPGLADELLPELVEAALSLVDSLGDALPGIIQSLVTLIIQYSPQIMEAGVSILAALGQGLIGAIPTLIEYIPDLISGVINAIVNAFNTNDEEVDVTQGILGIFSGLGTVFDAISKKVKQVFPFVKQHVVGAFNAIMTAIKPIIDAFSKYVTSGQALEDVTTLITEGIGILANIIIVCADALAGFIEWITSGSTSSEAFLAIVVGITAAFVAYEVATNAVAAAQLIATTVTNGLAAAQSFLNMVMSANPIGLVVLAIVALVAAFTYAWNNIEGFREFWISAWENIVGAFEIAWDNIINFFTWDIPHAFDAVAEWWNDLWEGFFGTFETIWDSIVLFFTYDIPEAFDDAWEYFTDLIDEAWTWGQDLIDSFVDGILSGIDWVGDAVSDIADEVRSFLGFSEPDKGPLSNFHTFAPDMIDLFTQGINDNLGELEDAATNFAIAVRPDLEGMDMSEMSVTSVKPENETNNDTMMQQMVSLLSVIANKDLVELSPNEDKMFDIIRKKNNEFQNMNGNSAFA